jgi:predicted kinase
VTTQPVPVLLLNGPVGVGKSTVGAEVSWRLSQAHLRHAFIDMAVLGTCWPAPPDDPWNERLVHRNLACVWANCAAAGAQRLVVCRVLEARSLLDRIVDAVPGARITVVRLQAPLPVLQQRLRAREAGCDPSWYLDVAAYLVDVLERSDVADHVVDNAERPVPDVAREVLRLARWPS